MPDYECFCGEGFDARDDLVAHNVDVHDMNEEASRRAVDEKYPRAA